MIYALKVSLICAAGMLVTELLNLPKAYLFPLSVVVVTQPYTKLTRKAAGSRMLNTYIWWSLPASIFIYRYHMVEYPNPRSNHHSR